MKQDLVFSVELHLGLIPYPLSHDPYPFTLIPCPLSLIPYPVSLHLSPSTVPSEKFRWGCLSLLLSQISAFFQIQKSERYPMERGTSRKLWTFPPFFVTLFLGGFG